MTMASVTVTDDIVEFDLETLEPVQNTMDPSDIVDEIPFPYSPSENDPINSRNGSESESSDNNDYYELSTDSEDEDLPTYPINNLNMTVVEGTETNDILIDIDDVADDWTNEIIDSGPSYGPFMSSRYTNIDNPQKKPEVFFQSLFDERMWTILADATNVYARSKTVTRHGNRCTDPTHPDYKKFCRLNTWIDVTPSDIKMFLAHILIMGLVHKSEVEKYWNMNTYTKIPFFGKYMSRNRFQAILWNFHVNDDSQNPSARQPGHDPLCKIRPFVDMVKRNFVYVYKPSKCLSFDEACCPFKGRVKFRVYNPMKPNRFHIKLFQVSEAESGYILGFHVYTGKDSSCISLASKPLDGDCTKTTKVVLGLLEETKSLDKGHHIYMDNYYTSPELFRELFHRETYACGTARKRKGMPKTIADAKLKPLESIFMRNGPLLCLKWSGPKKKAKAKKPVTMLTTIHSADELLTKKKDSHGNRIPKPVCIYQYTKKMSGVDISDQYLSHHVALRKSMKWSRKLFFHMFNMVMLNSYILNKKFGQKMQKHEYIEYIATYLVESSFPGVSNLPQRTVASNPCVSRLIERHFPKKISDGKNGHLCRACNFTKNQLVKLGFIPVDLKRKTTSFRCSECDIPLCVTPCFEIFHSFEDYRTPLLRSRIPNI